MKQRLLHYITITLVLITLFAVCGCSKQVSAPTWQEQYDLGMRYLSDGNYAEAILAFTAAIEIDPKQVQPYVGRGDAYVFSGETEETLRLAKADYEEAIGLDGAYAEAYLGLADVYIRMGDYEKAEEILRMALERTGGAEKIVNKLAEMESGTINDSSGRTRKSVHIEDGSLKEYWLYEYDERGNNVKTTCYDAEDSLKNTEVSEFNEKNQEIRSTRTNENSVTVEEYTYNEQGRRVKEVRTRIDAQTNEEEITVTEIVYDDVQRTETQNEYDADGELRASFVTEYDENGIRTRGLHYTVNESGELTLEYYVVYIWNEDGTYGGYELFKVNGE